MDIAANFANGDQSTGTRPIVRATGSLTTLTTEPYRSVGQCIRRRGAMVTNGTLRTSRQRRGAMATIGGVTPGKGVVSFDRVFFDTIAGYIVSVCLRKKCD